MQPAQTDIGSIVRFHRKRAGLTQKDLADLAGIGKTAVFDIENDKETVQCDTLKKVLNALNITFVFDSPLMNEYGSQSPGTRRAKRAS